MCAPHSMTKTAALDHKLLTHELESKLLVSPVLTPIIVPYITPFKELRP